MFKSTLSILVILIGVCFNIVYGQDYSALEQQVKKAEQSGDWEEQLDAYMEILDTLCWSTHTYPPEAKDYTERTIDFCKSHHCGEKLLLAKLYHAKYMNYLEGNSKEIETFMLPTTQGHHFKDALIKAHFYHITGEYFYDKGLYPEAKKHLLIANKLYKKKLSLHPALYYNNFMLSVAYRSIYKDDLDSSFYYINKSIKIAEELEDISLRLIALSTLAALETTRGNYNKAIKTQLELVSQAKQANVPYIEQHYFKGELARYYSLNKEADKAFETIQEVIHNMKGDKVDNNGKGFAYKRLAIIEMDRKKYNEAIVAIDSALSYSLKSTSPLAYFNNKKLKISCLIKLEKYEEAEQLFLLMLKEAQDSGSKSYMLSDASIYHLYTKSDLTPSQKIMDELFQFYEEKLSNPKNSISPRSFDFHRLMTLLYIYKGNTQLAKEHLITTFTIQDSLITRETSRTSKELLIQYQTKEKEQQLEYQALELTQKTTQRNALIIAALMLLGLGWYFWKINQRLRASKQTIETQAHELQQLYEGKNRFFANIAHELRTPLTLIASPVSHVMKDENLPKTTQQHLSAVYRNATYLKQLVNQILDLSKKETGDLAIQIHQFQFSDLLRALIKDFQPFADYQHVEFIPPTNLDYAIELTTDGEKLFIVLKNLLSNAFKYTHSGGRVVLNYVDIGETVQVSVQDSGRGISAEDLPRIFNRYFQTSHTDTPIEGGTGIGLAVAKEYIESLGGTIQVNSELGKGSTFVVVFPKHLETNIPFSTEPLSFLETTYVSPLSDFDKKTIKNTTATNRNTLLIVEDNIEISQHLQTILEENYQLLLASNGQEALNLLAENTPDLILTDLMMPIMDGFELVKQLKANEKWHDIPVITLTARSEMTDKLTALRIGVDDYIIKPFHEEELSLRIQYLLENQEKRRQFILEEQPIADVQTDVEPSSDSSSSISTSDIQWLEELEAMVKKHIGNVNFNVSQLCLELSISSSQLYRKVKRLTGLSPKEYINQIRYTTARKLLEKNTYQSVKRVAYEVGFKDEKYFARNFKKRYGKYPSEYRM